MAPRTRIYYLQNLKKAKQICNEMREKYTAVQYKKQIGVWRIKTPVVYKPNTKYVVAHKKRAEINLDLTNDERVY